MDETPLRAQRELPVAGPSQVPDVVDLRDAALAVTSPGEVAWAQRVAALSTELAAERELAATRLNEIAELRHQLHDVRMADQVRVAQEQRELAAARAEFKRELRGELARQKRRYETSVTWRAGVMVRRALNPLRSARTVLARISGR